MNYDNLTDFKTNSRTLMTYFNNTSTLGLVLKLPFTSFTQIQTSLYHSYSTQDLSFTTAKLQLQSKVTFVALFLAISNLTVVLLIQFITVHNPNASTVGLIFANLTFATVYDKRS
jgi:hypothetical protein